MAIFKRAEYQDRLAKVKAKMARNNMDAVLVTSPENMFYLTGYEGESYYTSQGVIIAHDWDEPVLIVRSMDTACADLTVYLKPENIIGYPEVYIGSIDKHPQQFIAQFFKDKGFGTKRIGLEMGTDFFPAGDYIMLKDNLSSATFIDAGVMVNWVRTYKSDAEIAIMRQAGAISESAMRKAIETIAPGIRECDAAAEVIKAQVSGTPEFGGQTSCLAMPAGVRAAAPHLTWTDQPYPNDVSINIELGGARNWYHSGLSRTINLGKPSSELTELSKIVTEGLYAALEAVKAGDLCEDVETAWRRVINKAGYEKESRIGYSIGLCFAPSWIDQTASLQQGDKNILTPNMTFHMICGMWKSDCNFVISETFRVTDTGHECFANLDRKLFVKE